MDPSHFGVLTVQPLQATALPASPEQVSLLLLVISSADAEECTRAGNAEVARWSHHCTSVGHSPDAHARGPEASRPLGETAHHVGMETIPARSIGSPSASAIDRDAPFPDGRWCSLTVSYSSPMLRGPSASSGAQRFLLVKDNGRCRASVLTPHHLRQTRQHLSPDADHFSARREYQMLT